MDDTRLLSFDIEIPDMFTLGPGEDMERYGPFHISVASSIPHRTSQAGRRRHLGSLLRRFAGTLTEGSGTL
jgi:hypothetical protein